MAKDWDHWQTLALEEVQHTLRRLPVPLRTRAGQLPVTYEPSPSPELEADGIEPDVLGLFVGESWADEGATSAPLPAQIILFVDNLRDYTQNDETGFRREVRTTYLHELGHFLGLNEDELIGRGLE